MGELVTRERAITLLGHTIGLHATSGTDDTWPTRLCQLLAHFPPTANPGSHATTIRAQGPDAAGIAEITSRGETTRYLGEETLLRELERSLFAACARESPLALLLHAGAAVRDGAAILLPGHSGSGKTTLTLALAAAGWRPLTDDLCAISHDGQGFVVLPNPRCCHVSEASREALAACGVPVVGPIAGLAGYYEPAAWGEAALIRQVIVPRYSAGAELAITPLTQAQTAVCLIQTRFAQDHQSFAAQRETICRLVGQTRGWHLVYSDLATALAAVERLAGGGAGT